MKLAKQAAHAPRWPYPIALLSGIVVAAWASSLALGAATACVTALSTMCLATTPRSKRKVANAQAAARFISVLANQATVSSTVVEAIGRAAPLMQGQPGSVSQAAVALAEECRSRGVAQAADRFAKRANTAAADWLAEVITTSTAGGGKWGSVLVVLEAEASADAATAQHFHRQVASLLTQLAAATLLGAAIVVGAARINATSWHWLIRADGSTVALAVAVAVALVGWKLLAGVWEILR